MIHDSYFWALIQPLNFVVTGGCVHRRNYMLRAWGYIGVWSESANFQVFSTCEIWACWIHFRLRFPLSISINRSRPCSIAYQKSWHKILQLTDCKLGLRSKILIAEMLLHFCGFVIGPRDRGWPMADGQLAWRTNDLLVSGDRWPMTDGFLYNNTSAIVLAFWCSGRRFRIEFRKWNYSVCCSVDVFLISLTHLLNSIQYSSISGIQSWTVTL